MRFTCNQVAPQWPCFLLCEDAPPRGPECVKLVTYVHTCTGTNARAYARTHMLIPIPPPTCTYSTYAYAHTRTQTPAGTHAALRTGRARTACMAAARDSRHTISKVLYITSFCARYNRAITFQSLCQEASCGLTLQAGFAWEGVLGRFRRQGAGSRCGVERAWQNPVARHDVLRDRDGDRRGKRQQILKSPLY